MHAVCLSARVVHLLLFITKAGTVSWSIYACYDLIGIIYEFDKQVPFCPGFLMCFGCLIKAFGLIGYFQWFGVIFHFKQETLIVLMFYSIMTLHTKDFKSMFNIWTCNWVMSCLYQQVILRRVSAFRSEYFMAKYGH